MREFKHTYFITIGILFYMLTVTFSQNVCDNCLTSNCTYNCFGKNCQAYSFPQSCANQGCIGGYCCISTFWIYLSPQTLAY